MDALVTTEWLAANLSEPDLRIVDATWTMAGDGRDPAGEFVNAHIPGAVFLDLEAVRDRSNDVPMMLPEADSFADAMAALGIGASTRVVLYDNSPYRTAARAWVMLRGFGVGDVAILDGGLAKWEGEGRPTASGDAAPEAASPFPRPARAPDVRTLDEMKRIAANGGGQIVDARSATRFAGEAPEPRPGVEPGHIPGSRNLPYATLFHSDGTWKQGAELREAFDRAGVSVDRPIVATCGSGVTASAVLFGLHLMGHDGALYDGSWAEWGADPTTSKATGAA